MDKKAILSQSVKLKLEPVNTSIVGTAFMKGLYQSQYENGSLYKVIDTHNIILPFVDYSPTRYQERVQKSLKDGCCKQEIMF